MEDRGMAEESRTEADRVLFLEVQRFTQWWLRAILFGVAALSAWIFVQQIVLGRPFGNHPAPDWVVWLLLFAVGMGLPLLLLTMTMQTRVTPGRITIRFSPLYRRTIPLNSVTSFRARTYRPIREFGGWGIRWVPGKGVAYNVSGNQGVELRLTNGRIILIGSQRSHELETAIRQAAR